MHHEEQTLRSNSKSTVAIRARVQPTQQAGALRTERQNQARNLVRDRPRAFTRNPTIRTDPTKPTASTATRRVETAEDPSSKR